MSGKAVSTAAPPEQPASPHDLEPDDVLELLGDGYTQRILRAVLEEPRTGREIREVTDVSKPTVYRRLERLESAGLVRADIELDRNGHHSKRYRAIVASIRVGFEHGDIGLSVHRT